MKTLILFASRYGATEEIAYMLKSAVGGDVTVRRQGDLMKVALYYGGTQRANLKLATFTTREVTALGG